MGWNNFRELILGDDPAKMDVFLSFLFNKGNLDKWMRDEWCAIFDYDYVDKQLIGGVLVYESRASDLCAELKDKAYGVRCTFALFLLSSSPFINVHVSSCFHCN